MPCAVVVQLPDGSVVAIHGRAERVEQWVHREDVEPWWGGVLEMSAGVRVAWQQGFRMTWSDTAPPPPVDTPAIEPPRRELPR